MIKNIILAVLVLGLLAGGFFYWWNNQADVRELNKTLPGGVKVVKSLWGNEYRVVNKIDGYEFKVPKEWKGIREIEYVPEREEMGYKATSIGVEGGEGAGRIASIDRYKSGGDISNNMRLWAETNFKTFELAGDFSEDVVGDFNIVKTQENVHLGGMFVYFFKKDSIIYAIANRSEEFIRHIIINGKW